MGLNPESFVPYSHTEGRLIGTRHLDAKHHYFDAVGKKKYSLARSYSFGAPLKMRPDVVHRFLTV